MNQCIDKVISKGNEALLLDEDERAWCKIKREGKMCTFRLFNQNIPIAYRGKEALKVFDSMIACSTDEQAELCKQYLALLVYNGYQCHSNWLLPLDFEDLMKIFGDYPFGYIHYQANISNVDSALKEIQNEIPVAKTVFVYTQANLDGSELLSIYDRNITSSPWSCDHFWGQLSKNDTLGNDQILMDVWYH